jgi:predicted transcriptional regulator
MDDKDDTYYSMGMYYIYEDYANTVEEMARCCRAPEDLITREFEEMESRGLITIIRDNGKIKKVEPTEKGYQLYLSSF